MNKMLAFGLLVLTLPCAAMDLPREEVRFRSHGVSLSGTIVFPTGKPHAALVFVHGSGRQSRDLHLAERFATGGIATLVYDKRGAGKSGGEYEENQSVSEKNLGLLADDAAAALSALASHPSIKGAPTGFGGISQAGWIAPLAAQRNADVKFLVMWSGPVCKVSEEDIFSKYTSDNDGVLAPAYELALKSRTQKYAWPASLGRDTDAAEDLAKLKIPGLWIFSDNDSSIPVDLSISRLQKLRGAGHRYDYVLFSGLGHNNMDHTLSVATDWVRRLSK
jgi:hypothetical protein